MDIALLLASYFILSGAPDSSALHTWHHNITSNAHNYHTDLSLFKTIKTEECQGCFPHVQGLRNVGIALKTRLDDEQLGHPLELCMRKSDRLDVTMYVFSRADAARTNHGMHAISSCSGTEISATVVTATLKFAT